MFARFAHRRDILKHNPERVTRGCDRCEVSLANCEIAGLNLTWSKRDDAIRKDRRFFYASAPRRADVFEPNSQLTELGNDDEARRQARISFMLISPTKGEKKKGGKHASSLPAYRESNRGDEEDARASESLIRGDCKAAAIHSRQIDPLLPAVCIYMYIQCLFSHIYIYMYIQCGVSS